jgi:large subunit ribosomal protein L13
MDRKTHTIDATNKVLGRLAVEIALLLRGKNKANFAPNEDMGDFVNVKNIDRMGITGKKIEQKVYYRHSGYLGGLKETPLKKLVENNQMDKVLKMAVYGMLPGTKLRPKQLKRLTFTQSSDK